MSRILKAWFGTVGTHCLHKLKQWAQSGLCEGGLNNPDHLVCAFISSQKDKWHQLTVNKAAVAKKIGDGSNIAAAAKQ